MPASGGLHATLAIMDVDEQEQLPCAEKLVFDTREQAEAAAVVADYQHGTQLTVYLCRYCGLWHLASK